jgi:hypothetical protein
MSNANRHRSTPAQAKQSGSGQPNENNLARRILD